jgi:hypothetical protein
MPDLTPIRPFSELRVIHSEQAHCRYGVYMWPMFLRVLDGLS